MDETIKQLARSLQTILDASPDPAASRPSIYLHERYRGQRDIDGNWLPDLREREAQQAGYRAATEYKKKYSRAGATKNWLLARLRSFFPRSGQNAREPEKEMANADKAGRLAYFQQLVIDELTAVSDPVALEDLGIYMKRLGAASVGEAELPVILMGVAEELANDRDRLNQLSAIVLGMARGSHPDSQNGIGREMEALEKLIFRMPAGARAVIRDGILRISSRKVQGDIDRQEAITRSRQTRYKQSSDFLADLVNEERLDPFLALEKVAQLVSRTSEGRFPLADEFRVALSERFADPDFGSRVALRMNELAHEEKELATRSIGMPLEVVIRAATTTKPSRKRESTTLPH